MSNFRIVTDYTRSPELAEIGGRDVFYKTKRQAANAYRAAARFLEKNPERWTRGSLFKGYDINIKGPSTSCMVCAVGALNLAVTGDARGPLASEERSLRGSHSYKNTYQNYLLQLEETEARVLGKNIVTFNDIDARGPRDVVKALRKVAAALDHGEKMDAGANFKIQEIL